MNVYYRKSGNTWKEDRRKSPLSCIPVNRTFLWGSHEIRIPALYIGREGVVIDICSRLPIEEILRFQRKWPRERRLSLKNQEDFEQIDADNPGSRDFLADLCLDGQPLACRMSASLRWYPEALRPDRDAEQAQDARHDGIDADTETPTAARLNDVDAVTQTPTAVRHDDVDAVTETPINARLNGTDTKTCTAAWHNDADAEALINAYECDRNACWHLGRILYDWKEGPILSPSRVSLTFHARPISVTTEHFTTMPFSAESSMDPREIRTIHPATGQEYTLTLHGCEETMHDFSGIGAKEMLYPEHCQILSYSISPEIEPGLFEIRDCGESDPPRPKEETDSPRQSGSGCTAFFLAGRSPSPDRRVAFSSLHFEPVREVRWRTVFQVKPLEDLEIHFRFASDQSAPATLP